jgi:hypothetical protein
LQYYYVQAVLVIIAFIKQANGPIMADKTKPLVFPDKRFTFYTTKKESTKERNSELYSKPPEGGSEFIPVHLMD